MNKIKRLRKQFIKMERIRLLNRLDELSLNLKKETDSMKAEDILEEMRSLGAELERLVTNSVPDHEFKNNDYFKETGKLSRTGGF